MSEWQGVFNERGLLMVAFGALGGAVRSAALKTTWREGMRVVFIGAGTAFGVGTLAPLLLQPWIGDLPEGMSTALGTLCAAAFIVGLISVTTIERIVAGKSFGPDNNSDGDHRNDDHRNDDHRNDDHRNDDHRNDDHPRHDPGEGISQ